MALRVHEVRGAYARVMNRAQGADWDLSEKRLRRQRLAVLHNIATEVGIPEDIRPARKADLVAEIRRYAEVIEAGR